MFAGFHDQGGRLFSCLSSDVSQFVGGQVSQIVTGLNTRFNQLGNQLRRQAWQVTQILRNVFNALFTCNLKGQQRIFGTRAQLVDRVFVKAFDLLHFLDRNVSDLLQAGKTFTNQNVGNFLVNIKFFHEQLTNPGGFFGLLLSRLSSIHDVDLPAGQV